MVTYGVLIWLLIGAFFFGSTFGLFIVSLMVVAKDKIEVRKEEKSDERDEV